MVSWVVCFGLSAKRNCVSKRTEYMHAEHLNKKLVKISVANIFRLFLFGTWDS